MSLRRVAAVWTAQLLHIGMHDQIFFTVKCLGFQLLATDSNILKYGKQTLSWKEKMPLISLCNINLAVNNDNSKVLEKSTVPGNRII